MGDIAIIIAAIIGAGAILVTAWLLSVVLGVDWPGQDGPWEP